MASYYVEVECTDCKNRWLTSGTFAPRGGQRDDCPRCKAKGTVHLVRYADQERSSGRLRAIDT